MLLKVPVVIVLIVLQTFALSASAYGYYGSWGRRERNFYNQQPRSYHSRRSSYLDYDENHDKVSNRFQQQDRCNCVKVSECRGVSKLMNDNNGYISEYYHYNLARLSCGYIDDEIAVCCQPKNSAQKSSRKRVKKPILKSAEKLLESGTDDNRVELTLPSSMKNFCPSAISDEFELDKNHKFHREPASVEEVSITIEPRVVEETTMTTTMPSVETTTLSSILDVIQGKTNLTRNLNLVNNQKCGRTLATRISGGQDAGIGEFPWVARLAYRNKTSKKLSFRCGGTLISDKYVLTAAHCVSNLISILEVSYVRLGDFDTLRENECENGFCVQEEDFEIEKIIVHPNYNQPLYSNDIALLKLAQPTGNTDSFRPICLPVGDYVEPSIAAGNNAIVAGFGITNMLNQIDQSTKLQWIRLPFVETDFCASFYYNYTMNTPSAINITSSQLCVQGRENSDACSGDSGGPLMSDINTEDSDRYVLYGLVSFGPRRCGLSNFPSVYARVSSYMEWIMRNID